MADTGHKHIHLPHGYDLREAGERLWDDWRVAWLLAWLVVLWTLAFFATAPVY